MSHVIHENDWEVLAEDYRRTVQERQRRVATKYRVVALLHDSQQVKTLLGQEEATERRLVIKMVQRDALTGGLLARLEHDASIRHHVPMDWVAPVMDYGRGNDDEFHVVMPFVEGVPLSARLARPPFSGALANPVVDCWR